MYVEDHATIFFLTVDCAALFFSKKTLSLKEYPLRICKTVRYEEATVRPWERQWNYVTHNEITSLFLTSNTQMERVPTKIIWKIHALFTYIAFQISKVFLIIICKIQPQDILFVVVFTSFLHHQILFSIHFQYNFTQHYLKKKILSQIFLFQRIHITQQSMI